MNISLVNLPALNIKSLFQKINRSFRTIVLPLLAVLVLMSAVTTSADAAIREITLKDLNVEEVIYLPTTQAQREILFTKPKSWRLSSNSYIDVSFQHSLALLPQSSWLQVLINDKVVKHVKLTPANAKLTKMKVPLPVGNLKDVNTLSFRVEQHYTDRCEDPLDQSLWTQVLGDTKMVLDYQSVLEDLDLVEYPYPVIDSYAYGTTSVRYVVPDSVAGTTLQALSYLNVNFAQSSSGNQLDTSIAYSNEKDDGESHLVYVGTPANNAGIRKWAGQLSALGQGLNGNNWSSISGDGGLIAVFRHPAQTNRAVIIVSGNTQKGVLQAAKYVTTRPLEPNIAGQVALVEPDWQPSQNRTAKTPRYIVEDTRTFEDLGYGVQAVQKVNAPPIIYNVPFMADFDPEKTNAKAYLDLVYSYSAGINPLFSSLELRLNNVSIGSVPLLNEDDGEEMAKATIPIPTELIQPHNELIAQFHLKPDKFGYCVGDFKDDAWGKIYEDSQIRIEGSPESRLPNFGLFNYTGFPFSQDDNLENMHLALIGPLDKSLLNTMLSFTARLGRATLADTDLRFSVSQEAGNLPHDKNIVLIRNLDDTTDAPDGLDLGWSTGNFGLTKSIQWNDVDLYKSLKDQKISVSENESAAYLQQHRSPFNKNKVVSMISYFGKEGSQALIKLFQDDEAFGELTPGQSQVVVLQDLSLEPVNPTQVYEEAHSVSVDTASGFFGFLKNIPWMTLLWIALGVVVLLLLLPVIIRKIRYGV